jgi:hypothetical protein
VFKTSCLKCIITENFEMKKKNVKYRNDKFNMYIPKLMSVKCCSELCERQNLFYISECDGRNEGI